MCWFSACCNVIAPRARCGRLVSDQWTQVEVSRSTSRWTRHGPVQPGRALLRQDSADWLDSPPMSIDLEEIVDERPRRPASTPGKLTPPSRSHWLGAVHGSQLPRPDAGLLITDLAALIASPCSTARTQVRNASGLTPNWPPTRSIAPLRLAGSARASKAIRVTRSRNTVEHLR